MHSGKKMAADAGAGADGHQRVLRRDQKDFYRAESSVRQLNGRAVNLTPTDLRLALLRNGYEPLPIKRGSKRPLPVLCEENGRAWQTLKIDEEEIRSWPATQCTGMRTKHVPTIDCDLPDEQAAGVVRSLVKEMFGGRGELLFRTGRPITFATPLRCEEEFGKKKILFRSPSGATESESGKEFAIEVLADGQQVVVHGPHADTKKPYIWEGGTPFSVRADELPAVTAAEVDDFLSEAAKRLKAVGWEQITKTRLTDDAPKKQRRRSERVEVEELDEVETILMRFVPADDLEVWYQVCNGLKNTYGARARDTFLKWSATSPKSEGGKRSPEKQWDIAGNCPDITLAKIFYFADRYCPGWREILAAERGFEIIRIVDGGLARAVDKTHAALLKHEKVAMFVRGGALVEPISAKRKATKGRDVEVTNLRAVRPEKLTYLLNKYVAIYK